MVYSRLEKNMAHSFSWHLSHTDSRFAGSKEKADSGDSGPMTFALVPPSRPVGPEAFERILFRKRLLKKPKPGN